jgi:hypothetical protein
MKFHEPIDHAIFMEDVGMMGWILQTSCWGLKWFRHIAQACHLSSLLRTHNHRFPLHATGTDESIDGAGGCSPSTDGWRPLFTIIACAMSWIQMAAVAIQQPQLIVWYLDCLSLTPTTGASSIPFTINCLVGINKFFRFRFPSPLFYSPVMPHFPPPVLCNASISRLRVLWCYGDPASRAPSSKGDNRVWRHWLAFEHEMPLQHYHNMQQHVVLITTCDTIATCEYNVGRYVGSSSSSWLLILFWSFWNAWWIVVWNNGDGKNLILAQRHRSVSYFVSRTDAVRLVSTRTSNLPGSLSCLVRKINNLWPLQLFSSAKRTQNCTERATRLNLFYSVPKRQGHKDWSGGEAIQPEGSGMEIGTPWWNLGRKPWWNGVTYRTS